MGIFKKANNIYITVRDTYTSISGSSYEEAEEVIIEATNGDLELISQKKVIMQGLGKEDEEQEIEQSEPNNSDNEPNFFINFRLPKDYKGDFGFDWMRREYLDPNFCKNVEKIKREYNSDTTIGNAIPNYYFSFLNMYPNQKEVTLSLEIEKTGKVRNKKDIKVSFVSTDLEALQVTPSEISLKEISEKEITIKCLKPLSKNTAIIAKDEKGKQVGTLIVMKNDKQYKLNVQFVEVEFKGSICKKVNDADKEYSLLFSDEKIDFITTKNISNEKRIRKKITPVKNTLPSWKDYITKNYELFKNLLQQASIVYKPLPNYKKIIVDFQENTEIRTRINSNKNISQINSSIFSINEKAIIVRKTINDILNFFNGLIGVYKDTYGEDEKGVIVFLLPMTIETELEISENTIFEFVQTLNVKLDAYSDEIFKEGKFIMLMRNHSNLERSVLVHEIAHTLGLFHSFQEPGLDEKGRTIQPIHTFKESETNNIMDYQKEENVNKKTLTFWKWQWLKMQEDKEDLVEENYENINAIDNNI